MERWSWLVAPITNAQDFCRNFLISISRLWQIPVFLPQYISVFFTFLMFANGDSSSNISVIMQMQKVYALSHHDTEYKDYE